MRKLPSLLLVALLLVAGAARAHAADSGNVTICNSVSREIYFAVAYQESNVWSTAGWWGIQPKQCRGFRILHKQFWWHFETNPYAVANGKTAYDQWGTEKKLFVGRDSEFHFTHAEQEQGNCALRAFDATATMVGDGYAYYRIAVSATGITTTTLSGSYKPAPAQPPQSPDTGPDFE